jgi:hypothetical protein
LEYSSLGNINLLLLPCTANTIRAVLRSKWGYGIGGGATERQATGQYPSKRGGAISWAVNRGVCVLHRLLVQHRICYGYVSAVSTCMLSHLQQHVVRYSIDTKLGQFVGH